MLCFWCGRVAHLSSFLCCVFGRIRVADLFSLLCYVFGEVRVPHLFSFLCCVFGGAVLLIFLIFCVVFLVGLCCTSI